MNCDTSFHDFLSNCEDSIVVYAQLEPAEDYDIVITDKFGNQHKHTYTANESGFLQILTADFPPGLFNPHVGDLKLEIFTWDCNRVNFRIAKNYDAITFNIKGGTREKHNLGCADVGVYG